MQYLKYVGLILIISATGCSKPKEENEKKAFMLSDTMMKRIEIDSARIEPVKSIITLVGKVVPDQNKVIQVFPLVGGNVEQVPVELGDYVQKGQVLAVIKSGEVADFERQMIEARSDLIVAQKNLASTKEMYESKLVPQRDVISAQKDVDNAEAELERVNEIYSIYGVQKNSKYVVKSPIAGFVISKNINRDMQLRSDNSEALFTVGQISDVWVMANVSESDIPRVSMGMQAQIRTISYSNEVFKGRVDKIYNVLDPETKTMQIRIKLENNALKLKPEMHATVSLLFDEKDSMVAIPSQAVIFDRSKNWVLIYKSRSNIEIRPIEIHSELGDKTYVKAGVNPGEQIISRNQLLIYSALNN